MAFYHVYADESRQNSSRHMLFGALFIPRGTVEESFINDVEQFRAKYNMGREIKWQKVSRMYLDIYKEFCDIFFRHPEVKFSCLVVDTHKIDYTKYHGGDKETGFYAFYYLALSRNMNVEDQYLVFTDQKNNAKGGRLSALKQNINDWGREQGATGNVVANVEPRDSKMLHQLQLNDVLLGAVGYAIEEYNTAEPKVALVKHLETCIGCDELKFHRGRDTPFNIWRFDFSKVKEQAIQAAVSSVDVEGKTKEAAQTPNEVQPPVLPM